MSIVMPRLQAMVDDTGRPTVPYQRFLDELSRRLSDAESGLGSIVTIPRPEDYGAVGDGVTNDTVALQAFFDNAYGFGRLTDGATYLIDADSITIPGSTKWWGPRSATVENADADGTTLLLGGDDIEVKGFTIDGGNSSSTVANGYVSRHFGLEANGTSGDMVTDIRVIDLAVSNCGDAGIELFHVNRAIVSGCQVSRCGYIGINLANSRNIVCDSNVVSNIYPGDNAGVDGTNCYGITASLYTASSVYPEGVWITRNVVSNVVWEGLDEHEGRDIWITDNFVTDVGTGIASQHDESGFPARRITITGNSITGFGATKVIEGVTYRPIGGIICVGGIPGQQGQSLTVANNMVRSIGDNRTVPGQSGGIMFRNWREFRICNNGVFSALRHGIVSDDKDVEPNEYGIISGNVIDGVQSVGGTARDIYTGQYCAALVIGNFSQGAGNGFSQAGSPSLTTTFTSNIEYS